MMVHGLTDELMALRAAQELNEGDCVNLGIGLPALVSDFISPELAIMLHAENGLLGYGELLTEGDEIDPDCVNASSNPVRVRPGISFFHCADAFAMIRGGHVDVAILGGFQVSARGDLANWVTHEGGTGTLGGAMDLAMSAKKVMVLMHHTTKDGGVRIVGECSYPLTAKRAVDLIITNLGVIEVTQEGLLLTEIAPGLSAEEVQAVTEPRLRVSKDLKEV